MYPYVPAQSSLQFCPTASDIEHGGDRINIGSFGPVVYYYFTPPAHPPVPLYPYPVLSDNLPFIRNSGRDWNIWLFCLNWQLWGGTDRLLILNYSFFFVVVLEGAERARGRKSCAPSTIDPSKLWGNHRRWWCWWWWVVTLPIHILHPPSPFWNLYRNPCTTTTTTPGTLSKNRSCVFFLLWIVSFFSCLCEKNTLCHFFLART